MEFSDSDIKLLNVIRFLLVEYEENKENISFIARDQNLSFHRVKEVLTNLRDAGIITILQLNLSRAVNFNIVDKIKFRDYLYAHVQSVCNKYPKKRIN